jgi:hypothetical protein
MHPAVFLIGCMGARVGLGILTHPSLSPLSSPSSSLVLSAVLAVIGLGFLVIYAGDLRKTGIETDNKPIWWNGFRPFHGALYLLAAWLTMYRRSASAAYVLWFDALLGLVAFLTVR